MSISGQDALERFAAELRKDQEKLWRMVDDFTRPNRELAAQFEAALTPYKSFAAIKGDIFGGRTSEIVDAAKALGDYSLADLAGVPIRIADGFRVSDPYEMTGMHRDAVKALTSGLAMQSFDSLLGSTKAAVTSLETLTGSFGGLVHDAGAWGKWTDVARQLQEELTAGVGDETEGPITGSELKAAIEELSTELDVAEATEDLLPRLIHYLGRLSGRPRRVLAQIIWYIFLTILGNLLTPIAQPWWERVTGLPRSEAVKSIRNWGKETYGERRLTDHRIVTASRLNVRESDSNDGTIICGLPRGQLVRMLDKGRAGRVFIEFFDPKSHLPRRGWVAARYLAEF